MNAIMIKSNFKIAYRAAMQKYGSPAAKRGSSRCSLELPPRPQLYRKARFQLALNTTRISVPERALQTDLVYRARPAHAFPITGFSSGHT